MPVKHPHSSADDPPSFTSRIIHKFSSSLGSFNDRKQASTEAAAGRFTHQRSLRHTTKFCYNKNTFDHSPVEKCVAFYTDGVDDRQPPRSAEQSGEGKGALNAEQNFQRGFPLRTLKTVPELDASHVAAGHSIRRRRGFVGECSGEEAQKVSLDAKKARKDSPATYSEMHRLVNSDDYLLARGANPRTGVVTPGSHSAGSSIDRNQNDLSRIGRQVPSSRWRQRGDQWVSLDLDEPTPLSTLLADEPLEHRHQTLRTPQKLATGAIQDSLLDHDQVHGDHNINPVQEPGATIQLSQYPLGASMNAEGVYTGVGQADLRDNIKLNRPIKRRPVGSPPRRSTAESVSHPHRGASGSTDTVRKHPVFNSELRASSAPNPPNGGLFRTQPVEKNLPRIPASSSDTGSQTEDDSFLGVPQTHQQVDILNSKTSNISGRHTIEKELPCLPTNSGPFQLISDQALYPTAPRTENGASLKGSPGLSRARPKGPRESDLVYPHVRAPRPTYPIPSMARHIKPIGESPMPIPEYDNPPKHLLPSMQTTGFKVAGQRAFPPPREMQVLNRTRQGFDPLSNITTIPIDISMGGPRPPARPPRVGPGHQPPDHWMMVRGQRGFRPPPPPSTGTGIIMNTTMNMSADAMAPIPIPRTRPRDMTCPPMLAKAEATGAETMYGMPRIGPMRERTESTNVETRRRWMEPLVETMVRKDPIVSEENLMPKPLRSRLQPSQRPMPTNDMPHNRAEMNSSDPGLMRKCSRCNHGYVAAKHRNTDSVTPTSALQKGVDKPNVETKSLHPKGSPLPGLPQDIAPQQNTATQQKMANHFHEKAEAIDEHDHTICCPECCKLDCHEGCLGHLSSTRASNCPWSDARSSTSSGEPETPPDVKKTHSRDNFTRLPAAKPVQKLSMKDGALKSGNHIQVHLSKTAPVELTIQPPTPAMEPHHDSVCRLPDAVAAALKAMEQPSHNRTEETLAAAFNAGGTSHRKASGPRPIAHRRQRSSSLPTIETGMTSRTGNGNAQCHRAASGGSWLRVPTSIGFAMSCSNSSINGSSRGRTVSGASNTTIELQVPNLVSLASCGSYAALGDVLLIPLEAGRMWCHNHPQVFTIGREIVQRGSVMAQLVMKTGWRLWAMVFVYSKTGKIKFHLNKGETAGGFVLDVGRSLLYFIVFAALSTLAIRVMGLVLGLLGIIGWIMRTVFWVLKSILGAGRVL